MPPMSCAASSAVFSDNQRRCYSEPQNANTSASDPLLQRFLQQQYELSLIPVLRPDLMILPRQPTPLTVTTGQIVPLHIPWTPPPVNDPGYPQKYAVIPQASSIHWYTELPNLNFSDYVWADSAIRRMRIEAMYI
jgi:hypothetical protein